MRTVFITGGSRGIGKAIAEKFEEEGYHVVAPTRQELDLTSSESISKYIEMLCASCADMCACGVCTVPVYISGQ